MRILHVIPSIAPRYGGPSTVIGPMTTALNRLPGVEVEIVATDADGSGGRINTGDLPAGTVPVRLFRRTVSEQWKVSVGLWRWLARNAGRYDLLHVHALWTFATAASCAAARRWKLPVVIRPCGMLSEYTWNRSAWKKRLYWNSVERRNVQTARAIHATSPGEAADVARLGFPSPPETFVIPLGLEPAAWAAERRPDRLRSLCRGRAGHRPIVLFLSRLHPKKGLVDVLLPAFARLKTEAFLVVVGRPDDRTPTHDADVRVAADRLGLADRVALLGAVSPADRWAMFDGADVFVLPSHSENFGVVVTEAMARAVPVVVTDAVEAGRHAAAAAAGRVVPVDPEGVAAAIEGLLSDPAARRAAGERGRRYVQANLGWDGIARTIEAMYRSCLS